jgi:hypothetical protein
MNMLLLLLLLLLLQEAFLLRQLNHPHLVQFFGISVTGELEASWRPGAFVAALPGVQQNKKRRGTGAARKVRSARRCWLNSCWMRQPWLIAAELQWGLRRSRAAVTKLLHCRCPLAGVAEPS